jgi:hypothetical protein
LEEYYRKSGHTPAPLRGNVSMGARGRQKRPGGPEAQLTRRGNGDGRDRSVGMT